MEVLTINHKNFIAGESQTDLFDDAGFSPASIDLNLTATRGELNFISTPTDRGGATLTGNVIADTFDPAFLTNLGNILLDDDGAIYSFTGSTLTKKQTSLHNFAIGTSDIINFKDNFYITYGGGGVNSRAGISQLDYNLGTLNDEWWTMLEPGYAGTSNDDRFWRHPMEVVEKNMFIANKNIIYYWDGTTSGTAFTLPTDVNVTTLRKNTDGRTLLAFTGNVADASHTQANKGKVYYCDPTLQGAAVDGWSREVEIEAQVEGSRVMGGVVYVTWGKNFGYFDGSGLVKLKEFETSGTTYSHNIKSMDDILVTRDGVNVLAYGDLGQGKVWWNIFQNTTNSNAINNITYKGDNKLLVAYSDGAGAGDMVEIDYDTAGVLGSWVSNKIRFGSKVHISRIEVTHGETDTSGTTTIRLAQRNTEGDTTTVARGDAGIIEDITYVNQAVTESVAQCDIKTSIFQLYVASVTDTVGIKEIRIYYDPIK